MTAYASSATSLCDASATNALGAPRSPASCVSTRTALSTSSCPSSAIVTPTNGIAAIIRTFSNWSETRS